MSVYAKNLIGRTITNSLDTGSAHLTAYIEIRTGKKPTNPEAVALGTLLATVAMGSPAYGEWSNGKATASPFSPGAIVESGIPGWFRLFTRDGITIGDGDIGIAGSKKDLEFKDLKFVKGGTVAISNFPSFVA